MLDYWHKRNATITVCEQNKDAKIPDGVATQLGDNYLDNLDRFDVIMRNPAVPPKVILDKNPGVAGKITTIVNEFLRVCPTKNTFGVTGTKGKGTTSTLITKMLQAAGKQVFLGGNIGNSPFDFLDQITPESCVVLELSSFMLMDITHSPHIGVCVMVVPEHLNWHADMEEYITAKSHMFAYQNPHDTAVYFADNQLSHRIASASPGAKIPYYASPGAYVDGENIVIDNHVICSVHDLKLLGKHNWQNACAATTAVWQLVQEIAPIREVLTSFTGLEHRLELVRELDGVKYYDDSFGTTPETAEVAIEAFTEPKVVILGGSDKGASYDGLAKTVAANNVRQVIAIGQMAPVIVDALHAEGYTAITPGGTTIADIVRATKNAAQPGDVVLLSTACASFDMFKDYKDRGEQFKAAVRAL